MVFVYNILNISIPPPIHISRGAGGGGLAGKSRLVIPLFLKHTRAYLSIGRFVRVLFFCKGRRRASSVCANQLIDKPYKTMYRIWQSPAYKSVCHYVGRKMN